MTTAGRRIVASFATLMAASIVVFAAVNALPGDQATSILGRDASPAAIATLRHDLGLNQPPVQRYLEWLKGFAQGNLGHSVTGNASIGALVRLRLKNTALLLGATLIVLLPLSLLIGVLSGIAEHTPGDRVTQAALLLLQGLPEFLIGVVLIAVFAVRLHWAPAVSLRVTPRSLLLPTATLILASVGYSSRMIRVSVGEVLGSEYVAMARLRGISERRVVVHHVIRNALGPWAHAMALTIGGLTGSAVVIEYLFAYPGIGQGLVEAVGARDVPTVEALTLIMAGLYIFANLGADLLTVAVTPRLRSRA